MKIIHAFLCYFKRQKDFWNYRDCRYVPVYTYMSDQSVNSFVLGQYDDTGLE